MRADPRLRSDDLHLILIVVEHANEPNIVCKKEVLPSEALEIFEGRCCSPFLNRRMAESVAVRRLYCYANFIVAFVNAMLRAISNERKLLNVRERQQPTVSHSPFGYRLFFCPILTDPCSTRTNCLRASTDETGG